MARRLAVFCDVVLFLPCKEFDMKLLNARKKLVNLAVASVVAGGFVMTSAPAHAVNVSQNNIGQVALFPYYTVKNGFDTLINVVNTTDKTSVFKIRFRESLNSREVRDFNVILSPYDVWTAVVTKDGSGALVRTKDNTCTSPILPNSATVAGAREVSFTSAGYDGTVTSPAPNADAYKLDGAGTDLARVQEGYIEVIAMGESSATASTAVIEYNSTHTSAGTPRDCVKVDTAFANASSSDYSTPAGVFSSFTAPSNALKGFASLINVANGTSVDANPTHLEVWTTTPVLARAGDLSPSLADGSAAPVAYWLNAGAQSATALSGDMEDAVTIALSATNVINEYTADGSATFTDWVITYPTKHFYTDLAYTIDPADVPFTQNFTYKSSSTAASRGKSCDPISIEYWNREELKHTGSNRFSPSGQTGAQFCYEVNILTFNGSNALGTGVNHYNQDTTDVGTKGWANITQLGSTTSSTGLATGVMGLPTIGFAAIVRSTGAAATNYGDSEPHTYLRSSVN